MVRTSAAAIIFAFNAAGAVRVGRSSSGAAAEEPVFAAAVHEVQLEALNGTASSLEGPRSRPPARGLRLQKFAGQLQSGNTAVLSVDPNIDAAAENLASLALSTGELSEHRRGADCTACKGMLDYQGLLQRSVSPRLSMFALVLWACVLIWLIATTAQEFFVPPLLYWSERLQLQPEVAGATLLALGNGAPDIFNVCTAASRQDLPLALSEMLGGNMFTLCITGTAVLAACYIEHFRNCAAREVRGTLSGATIHKQLSLTDHFVHTAGFLPAMDTGRLRLTIGVYLVTLCAIAFILFDNHLSLVKASCLPLLYFVYIVALLLPSDKNAAKCCGMSVGRITEDISELKASSTSMVPVAPCFSNLGFEARQCLKGKSSQDVSQLQLLWRALTLPLDLMRWATIPPSDCRWDDNRRLVSSICPVGILIFCMVAGATRWQAFSLTSQMMVALLAIVASLTIYCTGGSGPSLPWFYPALTLTAQISSILWLATVAGELTAIIETAGMVMEVPRSRLGFTAISWGDALGDTLTCIAMVRSGQARAALMAVFANSVLDDLLGFGLALVLMASEASSSVPIWAQRGAPDLHCFLLTSFVFLFAAVFILCSMLRYKGCRPHVWSGSLLLLYVVFLFVILKFEC